MAHCCAAMHGVVSCSTPKKGDVTIYLEKYFKKNGSGWQVNDELRKKIRFEEINLVKNWPYLPRMDIVFVRNVMIYFDMETKKNVLKRMGEILEPDGYLFLGGAETPLNICDHFERFEFDKSCYYQLKKG